MRPWAIVAVLLIVVGIVLVAVTDETATDAAGFACAGVGAVLLTGLAFYAVGRSEDRAREAEERRR